jgi:M6 family metalloprotease-like protein
MKKIIIFIGLVILLSLQSTHLNRFDGREMYMNPIIEQNMSASLEGVASFHNIVIFIRFKDEVNYEAPYALDYYENMLNGVNQTSLRDYYLEVSYGKLDIISEIVLSERGIYYYTDIYDRSYYSEKSSLSQAKREHQLLKRAINEVDALGLIDPAINLDANNDGEIDSITFMVSGEDNGWGSLLWPHKWELYDVYGDEDAPEINGVKAYTYTFNLLGNTKNYGMKASVGVLAHETFHLLGAPDLYHYYDFFDLDNAGPWSLMDNSAATPVHMLGYMKETYGGWIEDVETITTSGTFELAPLASGDDQLLKIDTGYSNEYVYLEYRFQEGRYESTLPDSGLLIYRVDKDYVGNEMGYATSSNGEGINEVFVFRPNIGDITEPIRFPNNESSSFYGDLNRAAISNFNAFKEAGTTTSFMLFHSDGTLMDLTITNVIESNGRITFDITMNTLVDIQVMIGEREYDQYVKFIDHLLLSYELTLVFDDMYDVYYAYLNEEVSNTSNQYMDIIAVSSEKHILNLAIYLEDTLIQTETYDFEFVDVIETNHDPYGNLKYIYWYIPPIDNLSVFELKFNAFFELEEDYDFLYILSDNLYNSYTGTSLQNTTVDLYEESNGLWIWFESDEYVDDFYGVFAEIYIEVTTELPVSLAVFLKGLEIIEIPFGQTYEDEGLRILLQNQDLYDVIITEIIDPLKPGDYRITYDIYEEGVLIYSLFRTVIVFEPITVGFSTIFDFNYELGSAPINFNTLLFQVTTNSANYEVLIDSEIDYSVVGTYEVILTVKDDFGFESSQAFEVTIEDSTAPEVRLNISLDTIYVGDTYVDQGIIYEDLSPVEISVSTNVDTDVSGIYFIIYEVMDAYGNLTTRIRYIHVVQNNQVQFHITPSLTTLRVGETYRDQGCYITHLKVNYGCEIDVSEVNHLVVGDYPILYSVTILGKTYVRTIYIFVVERSYKQEEAILVKMKEDFL